MAYTPTGRPPIPFSQPIADIIIDRLVSGESLRSICKSDDIPSRSTIVKWMASTPEFAAQYAHARDVGIDEMADETLDISDEDPGVGEHGTDSGAVAHQRLRVDTRKWYVSKLAPKKYGDRLALEHSGEITIKDLDDTARVSKLAALFEALRNRPAQPEIDVDDML